MKRNVWFFSAAALAVSLFSGSAKLQLPLRQVACRGGDLWRSRFTALDRNMARTHAVNQRSVSLAQFKPNKEPGCVNATAAVEERCILETYQSWYGWSRRSCTRRLIRVNV